MDRRLDLEPDLNSKLYAYSYSIQPNIATIRSRTETIPAFPLGENLDEQPADGPFKLNVTFDVLKEFSYRVKDFHKFQNYWGLSEDEEVYYQRPVGMGITLKLYLKNLFEQPTLVVNGAYFKFVRFKVDSVYPPGVHLADILTVNLLARSYCPVHCAAISSPSDGGVLLFAPPDTGKTLTTFRALQEGFHYMAEDIAFIDTDFVYANPHTVTFLHNKQFAAKAGVNDNPITLLINKIPLLCAFNKPPKVSMANLMKDFQIDERAPIRKVFLMDRGPTSIESLDPKVAAQRILLINRNEFSYHKNALLFAYSYFNPSFDIYRLMENERQIISNVMSRTECYLIQTKDPLEYLDLIKKVLRK